MNFTWLTYRRAIRKAAKLEYAAFQESPYSYGGIDHWHRRMHNSKLLRTRYKRERRK